MPDGSIVLVEMFGPRLTRVAPDGTKSTIAEIEGGPNGAAVGPDGAIYLCNNGGCFAPAEFGGMMFPGAFVPEQLHRRPDPARRSPRRHRHRPVHRVRRPAAARTERSGDGRPRRVLVHRPRHPRPCDPHQRPHRRSTTPERTGRRSARSCSPSRGRTASVCRPTPTRSTGPRRTTGRVFRRAVVGGGTNSPNPCRSTSAACCTGSPACSTSTRSPSTARDGSARPRCSTAVSRRSRPTAPRSSITPRAT